MKATALLLGMILTAPLFANDSGISYQDQVRVEKVVLNEELLIQLYELPKNSIFEGERMIAGQFESSSKKKTKKSYLDGLRSKLNGSQMSRF